jgi:peptidoglycan L-alanyl-D-glutamate endopeptidase CwlK
LNFIKNKFKTVKVIQILTIGLIFFVSYSIARSQNDIPEGLKKLLKAYPDFLESADQNNLYWKDGTVMVYDDGITEKTHEEMLNDPDLEDMLFQEYTAGRDWSEPPAENFEPGRIRYEPFFLKMYGNNSGEVNQNLESVTWVDGSVIAFSNVNGAADKLRLVINELSDLPGEYQKYLKNIGGTFVWRNIAGTDRLSNHSFGTAIDVNTKYSDYWKWNKNLTYVNRIPIEIVEIFEKHGFIWGGKWYHYDTMHFEYRPELIN